VSALAVNEIFYSIQGEGTRAGRPCVFIRLTGCPLRCAWCDTSYAYEEGARCTLEEVVAEAERFPCRLALVTGGEPLAQPGAWPLVRALLDRGFEVLVETSGHLSLEGRAPRAVVIMDLKAPSSGEANRMDWGNLDRLLPHDELKLVLLDRTDYLWARSLVRERNLAERGAVLLAPVHGRLDPGQLGRWILEDGLPVRLQLQLHRYLWPAESRGV
jgi:7-carboxy-7-deazaguanine synthase